MGGSLGWVFAVAALLLLLGWYLSFSAARLDRLHTRVEAAGAALDAELVRRSAAALEAAPLLAASAAALVADAAGQAMAAGERGGPSAGREEAENRLSRALQVAFADLPAAPPRARAPLEVPLEAPVEVPVEVAVEVSVDARGDAAVDGPAGARNDPPGGARPGPARTEPPADLVDGLAKACERVQLARRFHNDAVAQAQRVRRKRVVRWARLAGRATMPQMFEIDDSPPPALVR